MSTQRSAAPAAAPTPTHQPLAERLRPRTLAQVIGQYPSVSGAWGEGRLVRTTLVNAVLTTDGRLAIGAVEPELLYAALS